MGTLRIMKPGERVLKIESVVEDTVQGFKFFRCLEHPPVVEAPIGVTRTFSVPIKGMLRVCSVYALVPLGKCPDCFRPGVIRLWRLSHLGTNQRVSSFECVACMEFVYSKTRLDLKDEVRGCFT